MDMRLVELMCSRLCHDLVSPVGAIHNGLELLEEMEEDGGGFAGEAIKLIAHSSDQAERRLRLFRLAYGQAGRDVRSFDDVRRAAEGWLEGGRTKLDWSVSQPAPALAARTGLAKTLLNVVVLADEALPSGGTVTVRGEGPASVSVAAAGRNARLTAEAEAATKSAVGADELTARTVHAFATACFAQHYGIALSFEAVTDRVVFRLSW